MRKFTLVAASVFALVACAPVGRITLAPGAALPASIEVVAHRGCWQRAPENSIAASAACRAAGIGIIEIDVRRTADGTLVLMHDETVDRSTNGRGAVASMTWEQLAGLRLRQGKGGMNAALTEHAPPRLADALDAVGDEMLVNLDVKDTDVFDAVLALLRERGGGANIIVKTALAPGSPGYARFKNIAPVRFMPVVRQCGTQSVSNPELFCVADGSEIAAAYDDASFYGYELIFTDESFLAGFARSQEGEETRIWVNALASHHAAGHTDIRALSDPDAHWGRLVSLGATIIQTDYPERLEEYLAQRTAQPAQP